MVCMWTEKVIDKMHVQLCDEVKNGLPSCTYSAGPSIVAGIWAAVIDVGLAVGPIVASNTSTSVSTIAIVSASGPVLAGGVALTGEEVCTCVCTLILSLCCVCTLRQRRPDEFPRHSSSPHVGMGGKREQGDAYQLRSVLLNIHYDRCTHMGGYSSHQLKL